MSLFAKKVSLNEISRNLNAYYQEYCIFLIKELRDQKNNKEDWKGNLELEVMAFLNFVFEFALQYNDDKKANDHIRESYLAINHFAQNDSWKNLAHERYLEYFQLILENKDKDGRVSVANRFLEINKHSSNFALSLIIAETMSSFSRVVVHNTAYNYKDLKN